MDSNPFLSSGPFLRIQAVGTDYEISYSRSQNVQHTEMTLFHTPPQIRQRKAFFFFTVIKGFTAPNKCRKYNSSPSKSNTEHAASSVIGKHIYIHFWSLAWNLSIPFHLKHWSSQKTLFERFQRRYRNLVLQITSTCLLQFQLLPHSDLLVFKTAFQALALSICSCVDIYFIYIYIQTRVIVRAEGTGLSQTERREIALFEVLGSMMGQTYTMTWANQLAHKSGEYCTYTCKHTLTVFHIPPHTQVLTLPTTQAKSSQMKCHCKTLAH